MKIKFGCIVFLLSMVIAIPLFSQEYDVVDVYSAETLELVPADTWPPNLLVRGDSRLSIFSLQFLNGTPVSQREATMLISTVPSNQELMGQIRRGTIASWVLASLIVASAITVLVFDLADLPGADIMRHVSLGSVVVLSPPLFFITGTRATRFLRAVENYNLHMLGIFQ